MRAYVYKSSHNMHRSIYETKNFTWEWSINYLLTTLIHNVCHARENCTFSKAQLAILLNSKQCDQLSFII